MGIVLVIEESPDGWNYKWWETVRGSDRATVWSGNRTTFEGAMETVHKSIREKRPLGQLQNDDEVVETLNLIQKLEAKGGDQGQETT